LLKKLLIVISTVMIMPLLTLIITRIFNITFMDYAFIIAFIITVILWYASSKGGVTANYMNMVAQTQTTNFKMEQEKFVFNPSIVFFSAVGYTILIFIMTIVYYKDYFIQ
jgi:hypothetical protein